MEFTDKDVMSEQVSKMATGVDLTEPGSHVFSTMRTDSMDDRYDFSIAIISRDEYNRLRHIENNSRILSTNLRDRIREDVEREIRSELGMDWDEPLELAKHSMMLTGKIPDIIARAYHSEKPVKITGERSIDLENLIMATRNAMQKPEVQEAMAKYVKNQTEKYGEDVKKWQD